MGRLHHIALSALALGALVAAAATGGAPDRAEAAKGQKRPNMIVLMSDDQTAASQSVMAHTNALIGDRGRDLRQQLHQLAAVLPVASDVPHRPIRAQPRGARQPAAVRGLRAPRPPRRCRSGCSDGLLHGRDRQVPQRLRADSRSASRPDGRSGTGRSGPTPTTASSCSRTARSSPTARPTRTPTTRRSRRPTRPTSSPQGRRGDQPAGAVRSALLPLRRLPRAAPGGPQPADEPQSRCEGTAKPAARHLGAFANEPLPTPPNFNEADVSDKPAGIAAGPS